MRSRRFKKIFSSKKDKTLELDITSLLDILVILLVFLLKSYNASDLKLELMSKIFLPDSISRTLGNDAVIIQVDKNKKIWVDHKPIGQIQTGNEKIDFSDKAIALQYLKKQK